MYACTTTPYLIYRSVSSTVAPTSYIHHCWTFHNQCFLHCLIKGGNGLLCFNASYTHVLSWEVFLKNHDQNAHACIQVTIKTLILASKKSVIIMYTSMYLCSCQCDDIPWNFNNFCMFMKKKTKQASLINVCFEAKRLSGDWTGNIHARYQIPMQCFPQD